MSRQSSMGDGLRLARPNVTVVWFGFFAGPIRPGLPRAWGWLAAAAGVSVVWTIHSRPWKDWHQAHGSRSDHAGLRRWCWHVSARHLLDALGAFRTGRAPGVRCRRREPKSSASRVRPSNRRRPGVGSVKDACSVWVASCGRTARGGEWSTTCAGSTDGVDLAGGLRRETHQTRHRSEHPFVP